MQIVHTVSQLQEWQRLQADKEIGFVPTMGALHKGHLSLVQRACKENDAVAVSIFVNPAQFNDKADLERYPRTLDADAALLQHNSQCDVIFAPNVAEVYPVPDTRAFDFGALDKVMEGRFRSGHFNGVAQVVSRLFEILPATRAYFGEKDFQQLAIVKYFVQQLRFPVEIIACPIVREPDGLAMSSRNVLLTAEQRAVVPLIAKTLFEAVDKVCTHSIKDIQLFVNQQINSSPLMQVEYFEIVNALTLQPVSSWDEEGTKQACIAVQVGKIRLIDNVRMG